MRFSRIVPALLLPLTVLATARCYGPTEVTLDFTTDLACQARLTTGVYRGGGEGFEQEPETETSDCTADGTGARIGTLTVVPSDSSQDRASIKAVLTRNGKTPATCASDLTDCIVATRAFSFVSHSSRRVPIRFFAECAGKQCPNDQTCVAGGACVSNQVTCEGGDCGLPEERRPNDGGPSTVADGALDGGQPSDGQAPPATCLSSGGDDTLLSVNELPAFAASTATSLLFVPANDPTKVMAVPKAGGAPGVAFAIPQVLNSGPAKITALGVDGVSPLVAYDDLNSAHHVVTAKGDTVLASSATPSAVFAAFDSASIRVFVSTPNEIYRLDSGGWDKLPANAGGNRLFLDPTTIYVALKAGAIQSLPRTTGDLVQTLESAPTAVMAHDGANVYSAGDGGSVGKGMIVKLAGSQIELAKGDLPAIPSSLAIDDQFFFFAADATIHRVGRSAAGGPTIAVARHLPNVLITHLSVDPDPKGCVYYWVKPSSGVGNARLVIAPKFPRVNGGDGG